MSPVVVDASVVLAWLLDEDHGALLERVLTAAPEHPLLVPAIWASEVGNGLLTSERRRRVSPAELARAVELVEALEVDVDGVAVARTLDATLPLARELDLSLYDASYLELAMRRGLPLATLDARLKTAASSVGVTLAE